MVVLVSAAIAVETSTTIFFLWAAARHLRQTPVCQQDPATSGASLRNRRNGYVFCGIAAKNIPISLLARRSRANYHLLDCKEI
jgi:hypothetical protein